MLALTRRASFAAVIAAAAMASGLAGCSPQQGGVGNQDENAVVSDTEVSEVGMPFAIGGREFQPGSTLSDIVPSLGLAEMSLSTESEGEVTYAGEGTETPATTGAPDELLSRELPPGTTALLSFAAEGSSVVVEAATGTSASKLGDCKLSHMEVSTTGEAGALPGNISEMSVYGAKIGSPIDWRELASGTVPAFETYRDAEGDAAGRSVMFWKDGTSLFVNISETGNVSGFSLQESSSDGWTPDEAVDYAAPRESSPGEWWKERTAYINGTPITLGKSTLAEIDAIGAGRLSCPVITVPSGNDIELTGDNDGDRVLLEISEPDYEGDSEPPAGEWIVTGIGWSAGDGSTDGNHNFEVSYCGFSSGSGNLSQMLSAFGQPSQRTGDRYEYSDFDADESLKVLDVEFAGPALEEFLASPCDA